MSRMVIRAIGYLAFGSCFIRSTSCFNPSSGACLNRDEIAGIWKLTCTQSFLPKIAEGKKYEDETTLLMLNEDGSFSPYSNADESSSSITLNSILSLGKLQGKWDIQENVLILATDRPQEADDLQVHDTVLVGNVSALVQPILTENPVLLQDQSNTNEIEPSLNENDSFLFIPNGAIRIGKFMYPKRHRNFFDQPMLFQPQTMGSFRLKQVLGTLNTQVKQQDTPPPKVAKYHKRDFYGRKFLLTTRPTPALKIPDGSQKSTKPDNSPTEDYPSFDIRVMPIEFFANNTFQATGSNKVLRGRFGTTGEEKDRLWFQVSLFGAGRSMPGSVYSDGNGLTQEDRRGYEGKIEETEALRDDKKIDQGKKLFSVQGRVWYGSDFAKASPAAVAALFSLKEVLSFDDKEDEEDDNDEDDFSAESEFA